MGVFYVFSMVHPIVIAPFRPRSIPYIWPGRRDGQGEMQKEPSLLSCEAQFTGIQQMFFHGLKVLLTMFSLAQIKIMHNSRKFARRTQLPYVGRGMKRSTREL